MRNANIEIIVTVPNVTIKVLIALLIKPIFFVDDIFVCIFHSPLYINSFVTFGFN
jgi:hypothetical protein